MYGAFNKKKIFFSSSYRFGVKFLLDLSDTLQLDNTRFEEATSFSVKFIMGGTGRWRQKKKMKRKT